MGQQTTAHGRTFGEGHGEEKLNGFHRGGHTHCPKGAWWHACRHAFYVCDQCLGHPHIPFITEPFSARKGLYIVFIVSLVLPLV